MDAFLNAFVRIVDAINEQVGRATAWLTSLLVLVVCLDVISRYVFSDTAAWVMELEWHLFALIFLFGAGYTFKHDRHVRVDLFYTHFSERNKAWVNLLGGTLFLVPWCLLILYTSFGFALDSWQTGEGSPNPGGLPARYLIKFSICLGMLLLLLQALASIARALLVLRSSSDQSPESA
ncbi:MAG: TRAP transporter small permease subunit [Bacteroidota bacterium]